MNGNISNLIGIKVQFQVQGDGLSTSDIPMPNGYEVFANEAKTYMHTHIHTEDTSLHIDFQNSSEKNPITFLVRYSLEICCFPPN